MLDHIDPPLVDPLGGRNPRFPSALRAAVEASGLGLERIQRRMRDRGSHISVATLSYWQSGRSMPGRRESFDALGHLEAVLELPAGSLARLVPQRNSGARGVDSIGTLAAAIGEGVELPQIWEELDARLRRSLEMVSEHVLMVIGPDRTQRSAWNRRIYRAVASGSDRVLLAHQVSDANAALPRVKALQHCSTGERFVLTSDAVVITELVFDRVLEKGESVMLEYEIDYGPPYPMDSYHQLHRQLPLREFVMEVRFHAEARPTHCEWYEYGANSEVIRRTVPLELNPTNSILIVRHDMPPIRYGLRWFWD